MNLRETVGKSNYKWVRDKSILMGIPMSVVLRGVIEKERMKESGELIISDVSIYG